MVNIDLILDFIKKKNFTKKEFCKIANISVYYLNKILFSNGTCNIKAFIVVKIAKSMKLKLSDLINI